MQPTFQFLHTLAPRRPLVSVNAAMAWLDMDEDAIVSMIDEGILSPAFDISRHDSKRREIRISRCSILRMLRGEKGASTTTASEIIGLNRPILRTPEVRRILNCSQAHVKGLTDDGDLILASKPDSFSGPNAVLRIRRDSLENFLMRRML